MGSVTDNNWLQLSSTPVIICRCVSNTSNNVLETSPAYHYLKEKTHAD
jgi:hypothetical protein